MRILFRTDASIAQGTGHVVRCATLAQTLATAGHDVRFLSRAGAGTLNPWLEQQGLPVLHLPAATAPPSQQADALACRAALAGQSFDWLVVDHYALDASWEREMAAVATRMLAIDDLGRPHVCDVLLDQNYANPTHHLYRQGASAASKLLLGPQFALVRPDFAALRSGSLARRQGILSRALLFMGGSDPVDETTKALEGLSLARTMRLAVDVVIGGTNPHRRTVEAVCRKMPNVTLHVQTSRMAELMAAADLAISAGGSATWERCALGLPSLVTILASNQAAIAEAVAATGAHKLLGWHDAVTAEDYAEALAALDPDTLVRMSRQAAALCDGRGGERVMAVMVAPDREIVVATDEAHV
jgi:UDP-2,4-diacetamido-2,4,6-trideoxy-beta-L-altropyranose hydrolase